MNKHNFGSDIDTLRNDMQTYQKTQDALSDVVYEKGVELDIDIANAKLEDVIKHEQVMKGNIAELILGLDDVTTSMGSQFEQMQQKTLTENVVGWFSGSKAKAMQQDRVMDSSIESNLNNLISQSDTIIGLLQEQLGVLETHNTQTNTSLELVLADREETVNSLENVRIEMDTLDPKIMDLEDKISNTTSPAERTKLQTELQELNTEFNGYVQQEKELTARSQTLESYTEMYKTSIESLQDQITTQRVLISKLDIDTKQRVVLYDGMVKSLQTSNQQEVAHQINQIGTEVDKNTSETMAAIGSAAKKRMADMMEMHETTMLHADKVQAEKTKADQRFDRRFADIVRKHNSGNYGDAA